MLSVVAKLVAIFTAAAAVAARTINDGLAKTSHATLIVGIVDGRQPKPRSGEEHGPGEAGWGTVANCLQQASHGSDKQPRSAVYDAVECSESARNASE